MNSPERVTENIFRLCLPIPFPLRTVNVYALVGKNGWALIDSAIGTPATRAEFSAGLQSAGLRIEDLRAIVLTHSHPDHIGLSAELHEKSGAPVYIHPIDEANMRANWGEKTSTYTNMSTQFFGLHGLSTAPSASALSSFEALQAAIRIPPHEACRNIEDNQFIDLLEETYRVIWTPGHSDGQICLFRERDGVFIAADHILPRITPNISLYTRQQRPNPLQDYLDSLAKVATLPASLVLPGHGEPFTQLTERISQIAAHHQQRLQQILHLLARQPQQAYQLTEQIFGDRLKDDGTQRMALGEIVAHLEYLRAKRQVEQIFTESNGIIYAISENDRVDLKKVYV